MTEDEWATSTSAPVMLKALYLNNPEHFEGLGPDLHRYFIACCWKIKHLIPQENLRNGLRGATDRIDGLITEDELNRLDWYAEAEAFMLDYAESPEDFEQIRILVDRIEELRGMPFKEAKDLLRDAAYFTDSAMMYRTYDSRPYVKSLCTSKFLCPDLLREFVRPPFNQR